MSDESNPGIDPNALAARPRQFGKYLLLEKIGSGGMAEIFKAIARGAGDFQKVMVIKRILLNYSRDPAFVRMFRDEAQITAPLQHANIVPIFEFDQVEGQYYLAMEMVNGRDLQKVMARANKLGRPIPMDLCLFVVGEVCKALWYAYNARDVYGNPLKIIHRDVSPSNILVSFEGEVKVTDFGVAKAATSSGSEQGGVLKGKLGYMSPEQVVGGELDHRSDIFALGIILFESITLKRLFLGKSDLQTLINIRDADVDKRLARHPEIPEDVQDILRRALAREPDRRYRSANDLLSDIQDWLFAKNRRVGQGQVASYMRELFPEEADQDLLPLGIEEGVDDRATAGAPQRVESTAPAAHPPPPVVRAITRETVEPPSSPGREPVPAATDASGEADLAGATFRVRDFKGHVFGPVTFENMVGLLRSHSILEDEHCQIDDGEWVRVGDVAALRNLAKESQVDMARRVLLFEGNIARRDMVRLVTNISREKRLTGLLTLKHGANQKEVYFREGRPRFIASNLRSELLGEFLVARGHAGRETVEMAARRPEAAGGRIGDTLIASGAVAAHELAETLQAQFRHRFMDLFQWDAGWFGFFENVTAPKRVVLLDLDPLVAVTEAVRDLYPLDLIKAWQAEAMERRLVRVEGGRIGIQELQMLPKEVRITHLIDAHPTLAGLLKAVPQTPESFALAHRVVFLLVEVGILQFRGLARGGRR